MYIQIRWKTKPTDRFSITGMQKNQALLYMLCNYWKTRRQISTAWDSVLLYKDSVIKKKLLHFIFTKNGSR